MENIFLIGFRATGKTTVARILAARLGFTAVDMDEVLRRRHGAVNAVVARHGWEYFRAREKELLAELAGSERQVVATGGGAILHQDLWPRVMASGLVVWLTAEPAVIRARLQADETTATGRPSLTGRPAADEIEEVLAAREPLYRAGAHLALATDGTPPAELADRIHTSYRETYSHGR
ncbi:MAG: shikimate kinase [Thermodesulfobacteriota bacterium]